MDNFVMLCRNKKVIFYDERFSSILFYKGRKPDPEPRLGPEDRPQLRFEPVFKKNTTLRIEYIRQNPLFNSYEFEITGVPMNQKEAVSLRVYVFYLHVLKFMELFEDDSQG